MTTRCLAVYHGMGFGLGLLVFRHQLLRPEFEGELAELAGETERHLIILVVHWRPGVHADVEGLVDAHQERDGVRDRLGGNLLAVHRQDAGAALAGAGAVVFEIKHDGVFARSERRRALPAEPLPGRRGYR